jgi:hypothetical protein
MQPFAVIVSTEMILVEDKTWEDSPMSFCTAYSPSFQQVTMPDRKTFLTVHENI